jgi:hypothetical protein
MDPSLSHGLNKSETAKQKPRSGFLEVLMQDPIDRPAFVTAMTRLSTALNTIELTTERLAVYWDALCDLRIDGVVYACGHLARHWEPEYKERFPVPATIRRYVHSYREEQQQLTAAKARALLPAQTETTDEEALATIRDIIAMLDEKMDMRNVKRDSAATRLDARRVELLAQAQMIVADEQARKEREHAD